MSLSRALALWVIGLVAFAGCTNSKFTGTAARTPNGQPQPATGDAGKPDGDDAPDGPSTPGDDADDDDDDGQDGGEGDGRDPPSVDGGDDGTPSGTDGFTEEDEIQAPKACDGANRTEIAVGATCPARTALYTMDDMGRDDRVPSRYVCCPLPAGDVLSRQPGEVNQQRRRRCGQDELMTGAVDTAGNIYCTRINTKRYELKPAKLVCGGTKGAAFGIGAKNCNGSADLVERDTLPSHVRELLRPLGDDGCLTVPYGSVVIQQGGRRCEDSAAATLRFKQTDKVVPIFP